MVLLHTPEKKNNFKAPDFALESTNGSIVKLEDCMGDSGVAVMFICNHCPYVIAIIDRIVETCNKLQENGIGCIAIMSNDTQTHPADSFENMKLFAQKHDFTFPYVIDEKQDVAKAYEAVCTPDFFGFDKDGILQYRGRLDSAANKPADETTTPELLNAMLKLKNSEPTTTQIPSMGCSIKWKEEPKKIFE
ncbi:MAG: thioredoxin family protein [Alphaproteobacteria bacterium]